MARIVISQVILLSTQLGSFAAPSIYNPLPVEFNKILNDELSIKDIPTGEGGFQRDYRISLQAGDQITIDLKSEEFDTVVLLIAPDGITIGENDDGPDGDSNSLLFARIKETGQYIVRVKSFGAIGTGKFNLKITRLRPVSK